MTDVDTVELRPCPICGDTLQVTKSKMAVHSEQNRSTCILGSMGIPTDHPRTVAKWNTRAAIAALPPAVPATTPDPVSEAAKKMADWFELWLESGDTLEESDPNHLTAATLALKDYRALTKDGEAG